MHRGSRAVIASQVAAMMSGEPDRRRGRCGEQVAAAAITVAAVRACGVGGVDVDRLAGYRVGRVLCTPPPESAPRRFDRRRSVLAGQAAW